MAAARQACDEFAAATRIREPALKATQYRYMVSDGEAVLQRLR